MSDTERIKVVLVMEPLLEIVELRSTEFRGQGAKAWFCPQARESSTAQ